MQETYPYTINYNIVPIHTEYNINDESINIILYTLELPFININLNINSFIYCSLLTDSEQDNDVKEIIKSYITLIEELNTIENNDDLVNILDNNELIGNKVWLLESVYNNIFKDNNTDSIDTLDIDTDNIDIDNTNKKYIEDNNIIKDINELSNDEIYNKNIFHFAHLNKYIINKLETKSNNIYSDEEIASFTSTFFKTILDSFKYNNKTESGDETSQTDNIYNKVMNYYISNKSDDTAVSIDLILSSNYNYILQDYEKDQVTTSCGCNASSDSTLSNQASCYNIYKQAMLVWMKQMMSDIDNFYYKYFTIKTIDDNGNECYNINTDLIDDLLELISEFKNTGYDLSFSTDTTKFRNCNCDTDTSNSNESNCNYKTIEDFINILNIIKNDEIEENVNKIKLTGNEFAILLDKLYF